MRRSTMGWPLVVALVLTTPPATLAAQVVPASATAERWSDQELDNLLAPIALYPDPILAQVLVAATYPDQVLAAQAHVRAFGADGIDQLPWEISVKAVARYEPVLNLLADGEDWLTALGQAYASQPDEVMDAVQRLRRMANAQGNLQTTTQQEVVVEREVIRIVPAEPRVIYVPTYDPAVIYHQPVYVTHAHPAYWSWGVGHPIGVWLTYDFDWWGHRVYHHGWHVHGPRWVVVSRPWIVLNPFYVAPRHTIVVVNRGVINRRWDTRYAPRYGVVHRNAGFGRHDRGYRRDGGRAVADRRAMPGEDAYGRRMAPVPVAGRGQGRADRSVGNGNNTGAQRGVRSERERAVPAPQPRISAPRAPQQSAPRASAPRSGGGGRGRSESARERPRGN